MSVDRQRIIDDYAARFKEYPLRLIELQGYTEDEIILMMQESLGSGRPIKIEYEDRLY